MSEISHTTSFWHIDAVGGRPHQQIGNDAFTWFGTRARKSRLNFLDLLRAGHGDDVINAAALAYMRTRSLAGPVLSQPPDSRSEATATALSRCHRPRHFESRVTQLPPRESAEAIWREW